MWRVDGTGRKIYKERLVGCHRLLGFDPANRLVRHIGGKVVVLHLGRRNARHTVVDQRIPLIRLATDESIKFVESLMRRPAIVGTRDTCLPSRRFVPFAKCARAVTIEPQHFGQRSHAVGNLPRVARKCRRGFHNRTSICRMMIAPAFQRHPSGRAKRSRMKVVVPQTRFSQSIKCWRLNRATKRARPAKSNVVDQKQ